MCVTCTKSSKDCSELRFENMPIIAMDGNTRIVRCTEHVRSNVQIEGQAASGLSRSNAGLDNEIGEKNARNN